MATPPRGGCNGTTMANDNEMMDESRQTAKEERTAEEPRRHQPLKAFLLSTLKKIGIGKTKDKRTEKNDKKSGELLASSQVLTLPLSALAPYYSVRDEIDFRIKAKLYTEAVTLSNGDADLQARIENDKNIQYEQAVFWADCISHSLPFSSLLTNGLRKCYFEAMIWYMMCGNQRFPGDATIISEFNNWYYTEVEEFDLRVQFRKTLDNFNQHEHACHETRLMLQGRLIKKRVCVKWTMQEPEREDLRQEVLVMERNGTKATIMMRKTIKVNVGGKQNVSTAEPRWRVLMETLANFGMKLVDAGLDLV
ncbi:hypothetical protein BDZ45DRAFT_798020 [Acephala macrosclerotiorum]|nr:hypothetical protein BDZ45DRAFT_798020 [Acephala macrosclerotiorum]